MRSSLGRVLRARSPSGVRCFFGSPGMRWPPSLHHPRAPDSATLRARRRMASINDLELSPPQELPFPPGTSPFRQRGAGYLADVRYYDAVVRGGHQAVIDAIPDAGVRTFFRQPFRTSEWYDAYPGAVIEMAAARVRGMSFERHRRGTGAWHAEDAAHGI